VKRRKRQGKSAGGNTAEEEEECVPPSPSVLAPEKCQALLITNGWVTQCPEEKKQQKGNVKYCTEHSSKLSSNGGEKSKQAYLRTLLVGIKYPLPTQDEALKKDTGPHLPNPRSKKTAVAKARAPPSNVNPESTHNGISLLLQAGAAGPGPGVVTSSSAPKATVSDKVRSNAQCQLCTYMSFHFCQVDYNTLFLMGSILKLQPGTVSSWLAHIEGANGDQDPSYPYDPNSEKQRELLVLARKLVEQNREQWKEQQIRDAREKEEKLKRYTTLPPTPMEEGEFHIHNQLTWPCLSNHLSLLQMLVMF